MSIALNLDSFFTGTTETVTNNFNFDTGSVTEFDTGAVTEEDTTEQRTGQIDCIKKVYDNSKASSSSIYTDIKQEQQTDSIPLSDADMKSYCEAYSNMNPHHMWTLKSGHKNIHFDLDFTYRSMLFLWEAEENPFVESQLEVYYSSILCGYFGIYVLDKKKEADLEKLFNDSEQDILRLPPKTISITKTFNIPKTNRTKDVVNKKTNSK
ncbi:hypothetical protein RhiirA4_516422 [Rhizophagus irregularis]|uniref:Uncharacterized protein n=1 Tax=Rhizophagus irregularis TaxID=588596 RepID=A0A2I1GFC8_9GLOM|nr:hypothetical protein RhiirA4_516422 [Rhizophagus irregularis]